jgi:hypothetical protein
MGRSCNLTAGGRQGGVSDVERYEVGWIFTARHFSKCLTTQSVDSTLRFMVKAHIVGIDSIISDSSATHVLRTGCISECQKKTRYFCDVDVQPLPG